MSPHAHARRAVVFVLIAILGATTAWVAVAATPPRHAALTPRPPAVPLVTVLKTDGTRIRGELTASDPDFVTVTPAAQPGHAADAPADPVTVAWKEIRSLSNGLTQAKAFTQWKQAHHDQLCETCHGDRTVLCPTCKGTGHDPASSKDCPTCHGELLVECKGPRCDHGKVPCPNHCLQLTEGRWVTRPDGLKWRSFPLGRGVFSYSEHHLGHIIKIDRKAMAVTDTGVCPVCNGETKVDCPVCHGPRGTTHPRAPPRATTDAPNVPPVTAPGSRRPNRDERQRSGAGSRHRSGPTIE
jgi:hypothetical protein